VISFAALSLRHRSRREPAAPRDSRRSSRARVSEEPFGTLASVRQRERCLETDPLVGTVWLRMAGAVGRVMNVERMRLFLGVRAFRGAGGDSAIPFLDVARGRSSRCTSRTTAVTSSHSGLRRAARSPRRLLRTSTEGLERLDMDDVALSPADEAQGAAFNRKGDTRFVHAPRFAITSAADRIAVGSLRTYRRGRSNTSGGSHG
jgi:hypothetical protein